MTGDGACVLDHGTDDNGQPRRRTATIGLLCERHRNALADLTVELANLIIDTQRITDGGAPAGLEDDR